MSITSDEITIHRTHAPCNAGGCGKNTISSYNVADIKWLHVSKNAVPLEQLLYYLLEALMLFVVSSALFVLDFEWISGAAGTPPGHSDLWGTRARS